MPDPVETILPLPGGDFGQRIMSEQDANAGLVFYKFVNQWHNIDDPDPAKRKPFGLNDRKTDWIARFARKLGRKEELKAHCRRIEGLARSLTPAGSDAGPVRMQTVSRFVTGLGYAHGIENGFVFHHTLGVPYLPASGIKGLMRAFADHWQALDDGAEPDSIDWFNRIVDLFGNYGPPGKDDFDTERGVLPEHRTPRMGRLIVFDALPIEPVECVAEVMTPHDGGWRASGFGPLDAGKPTESFLSPGDWHNPVPIPFLAVETGQAFLFALGVARNGTAADLTEGYALLEAALAWIGAGAKTASGFGRFETPSAIKRYMEAAQASEAARHAEQTERLVKISAALAEQLQGEGGVLAKGHVVVLEDGAEATLNEPYRFGFDTVIEVYTPEDGDISIDPQEVLDWRL